MNCEQHFHTKNNALVSTSILANRNTEINCFRTIHSLYLYEKGNIIQKSLHELKYRKQEDLGCFLGEVLGTHLLNTLSEYDLIIPVPIDKQRTRERGYNQSLKLAEGLNRIYKTEINHNDILHKPCNKLRQSKKNRIDRWNTAAFDFRVRTKQEYLTKKILLLDDVITTGNTLIACQKELYLHGYKNISALTLAYA